MRLKVPPLGVFLIAGCGADLLINICLTLLGYFPGRHLLCELVAWCCLVSRVPTGHIHAFYLEYVYYKRKDQVRNGVIDAKPAAGVYSDRIQRGGERGVVPPAAPATV